jgi:hypothetical protein
MTTLRGAVFHCSQSMHKVATLELYRQGISHRLALTEFNATSRTPHYLHALPFSRPATLHSGPATPQTQNTDRSPPPQAPRTWFGFEGLMASKFGSVC